MLIELSNAPAFSTCVDSRGDARSAPGQAINKQKFVAGN